MLFTCNSCAGVEKDTPVVRHCATRTVLMGTRTAAHTVYRMVCSWIVVHFSEPSTYQSCGSRASSAFQLDDGNTSVVPASAQGELAGYVAALLAGNGTSAAVAAFPAQDVFKARDSVLMPVVATSTAVVRAKPACKSSLKCFCKVGVLVSGLRAPVQALAWLGKGLAQVLGCQ